MNTQASFDFLDDLATQDQQFSQCQSDACYDASQSFAMEDGLKSRKGDP